MIFIPIAPKPAPRINHQSRFTQKAKDYEAWKLELRLWWQINKLPPPSCGHWISFLVPPVSWSHKKRMAVLWTGKETQPDTDNYLKAYYDAFHPGGDQAIWDMRSTKVYAPRTGIVYQPLQPYIVPDEMRQLVIKG